MVSNQKLKTVSYVAGGLGIVESLMGLGLNILLLLLFYNIELFDRNPGSWVLGVAECVGDKFYAIRAMSITAALLSGIWLIASVLLIYSNAKRYVEGIFTWVYSTAVMIVIDLSFSVTILSFVMPKVMNRITTTTVTENFAYGAVLLIFAFNKLTIIGVVLKIALTVFVRQRGKQIEELKKKNVFQQRDAPVYQDPIYPAPLQKIEPSAPTAYPNLAYDRSQSYYDSENEDFGPVTPEISTNNFMFREPLPQPRMHNRHPGRGPESGSDHYSDLSPAKVLPTPTQTLADRLRSSGRHFEFPKQQGGPPNMEDFIPAPDYAIVHRKENPNPYIQNDERRTGSPVPAPRKGVPDFSSRENPESFSRRQPNQREDQFKRELPVEPKGRVDRPLPGFQEYTGPDRNVNGPKPQGNYNDPRPDRGQFNDPPSFRREPARGPDPTRPRQDFNNPRPDRGQFNDPPSFRREPARGPDPTTPKHDFNDPPSRRELASRVPEVTRPKMDFNDPSSYRREPTSRVPEPTRPRQDFNDPPSFRREPTSRAPDVTRPRQDFNDPPSYSNEPRGPSRENLDDKPGYHARGGQKGPESMIPRARGGFEEPESYGRGGAPDKSSFIPRARSNNDDLGQAARSGPQDRGYNRDSDYNFKRPDNFSFSRPANGDGIVRGLPRQ